MTRSTIVIAGATGFIGHAIARRLAARTHEQLEIVGLTRGRHGARGAWDRLVTCDLFSLKDVERALVGARYVAYFVHSMLPSARLDQGRLQDLDLICADNMGRAAAKLGVEQIVYLGGLLPDADKRSRHLASRKEVERALGAYGVPVTALRAAMIVGPHGSSFDIVTRLVRRLPVTVLPSWTSRRCQPIDIETTTALVDHVIGRRDTYGKSYDIGGPDIVTYRDMLRVVGEELGTRRPSIPVPFLWPTLSRRWISLVTGAPKALAAPWIESVRHDLVCADRRLQDKGGLPGLSFREATRRALEKSAATSTEPEHAYRPAPRAPVSGVRSVQRLPMPPGRDAEWAAHEYMRWLPRGASPLLRVEVDQDRTCSFYLAPVKTPLLVLTFAPTRSSDDRQLFYVTGGLLARPTERGRLEFRVTPDGEHLLAAIHDFVPSLPWWIYRYSQALVHLWVMHRFGRHLARVPPARSCHGSSAFARQ